MMAIKKFTKAEKIDKLRALCQQGQKLLDEPMHGEQEGLWTLSSKEMLKVLFGKESATEFEDQQIAFCGIATLSGASWDNGNEAYYGTIRKRVDYLSSKINFIEDFEEDDLSQNMPVSNSFTLALTQLEILMNRFDLVVKQLRRRHNDRGTLDVGDEYDVQDLFHALLKLYFDDVRAEEWTPSYAGCSSRIDFLLDDFEIAIEIKMTRKGLGNKDASDQLAIDKDHYRSHTKIKHLICFVYDPDGRIKNPRGFEKDLRQAAPLKTDVYVRP